MSDLKFVGAPRRRKPRALLAGAALAVLVAAVFLLGRRSAGPANAPAPTPVAVLSEPAPPVTPATQPAPVFRPAPTAPFLHEQPGARTSSEVFEVRPTPAPAQAPPAAAPVEPVPSPVEPETLAKTMKRCLSFTVSQNSAFTVTSGVRLDIKARNRCGQTFNGGEARFEVRAVTTNGSGVAGRERGTFQTTIQPYGSAETLIVIPCDPDGRYRFEVEVM